MEMMRKMGKLWRALRINLLQLFWQGVGQSHPQIHQKLLHMVMVSCERGDQQWQADRSHISNLWVECEICCFYQTCTFCDGFWYKRSRNRICHLQQFFCCIWCREFWESPCLICDYLCYQFVLSSPQTLFQEYFSKRCYRTKLEP